MQRRILGLKGMFGSQERDTSHGSAAWLSPEELKASDLVSGYGVPLGMGAIVLPGRFGRGREEYTQIRHAGDQHHLVVAGAGGGKFVSSLAPILTDMLETPSGSAVIVDPKGEALEHCGKLFLGRDGARDAREVVWLDPWNECGTGQSWRLNFLDQLTSANPNLVDDARALADAIIVPAAGEDLHREMTARNS